MICTEHSTNNTYIPVHGPIYGERYIVVGAGLGIYVYLPSEASSIKWRKSHQANSIWHVHSHANIDIHIQHANRFSFASLNVIRALILHCFMLLAPLLRVRRFELTTRKSNPKNATGYVCVRVSVGVHVCVCVICVEDLFSSSLRPRITLQPSATLL